MALGPILTALLVAATGLAGCLGDNQPGSALDTSSDASDMDGTGDGASSNATMFRFPGGDGPVNLTIETTGTLPGGPSCYVGGCGEAVEHPIDGLPHGVLTWLEVEVTHEPFGQFGGSISLHVGMDDGTTYSGTSYWSDQSARMDAIFELHSGGAWIEVASNGAHEDDLDYELTAVAWADPFVVHPRFPVSVPLGEERNLTVERAQVPGADPAEPAPLGFLLFDAADDLVASVSDPGPVVELTVRDDATPGTFVLVPGPGSAPFRLSADGPVGDDLLGRLSLVWEFGPSYPATGPAPVTWTYSVDRRPVSVGVYAEYRAVTIHTQVAGNVWIESPAGVVADSAWGCGMFSYCLTQGDVRTPVFSADRMSPDLVAGEYAYEVDAGGGTYAALGPAVLWYER